MYIQNILNTEKVFLSNGDGDKLEGEDTNDLLFGDFGSDTLEGGAGMDIFSYAGDPFEGEDVSAPERQIIAEEDFITDFDFTEDRYLINARDFDIDGDVRFVAVDAEKPNVGFSTLTNIVTLLNTDNDDNPDTPFIAGTAANQLADIVQKDGAGLFVYHNSELGVNRLVYSSNLNEPDADLKVISRQTDLTGQDAIDALKDFSADNFEFSSIPVLGDEGENELVGTAANEFFFGDLGSDTITSGAGVDRFAYEGDPFEGEDVSDSGRQIIGEEDFITDFDFTEDKYLINSADFGINNNVNFAAVDSHDPDASIAPGTNVVTLLNSDNDGNADTPFIAGTAANEIAELTTEDGAGLFVYHNSELELNRLVYSSNLNDADADLKVISRQTDLTGEDAIDALEDFSADHFDFEDVLIIGDTEDNELVGTADDELLFGDLGSNILTSGIGADIFAYGGNYSQGEDMPASERQILGEQDSITDFDLTKDKYLFNAPDFGITDDVNFTGVDANAPDALINPGTNVVTLLNSDNDNNPNTPFIGSMAAEQIAELTTKDGAGFFVYFNSDLDLNRVVHSSNLNDADADLDGIAIHTNMSGEAGINALGDFSADNFEFAGI